MVCGRSMIVRDPRSQILALWRGSAERLDWARGYQLPVISNSGFINPHMITLRHSIHIPSSFLLTAQEFRLIFFS
jgi:hypothetical protein